MEFWFSKYALSIAKCCFSVALSVLLNVVGIDAALANDDTRIAIIYPQVREPYSRIFKEIIDGITETIPLPIEQYLINKDVNVEKLQDKLNKDNIDSVIVLGSRAHKLTESLAKDKIVLTGAVFSTPTVAPMKFSGISMIASPKVLLNKLMDLAPKVKTVHVVYHTQKDRWIIQHAEQVLRQQNITLNAMPAEDVRSRARLYNTLFKHQSLSKTDAVWLLQSDTSLKEPGVFAKILENAWKKGFIVFSANPTHVRKGALFAMYPDNRKLGVSLANKMLSLRRGDFHSVEPLSDLLVAVNIRTAEHLELNIPRSERQRFNMVFPNR